MMWVSATSASVVDFCLRPLSWLGWIKLLEIVWNWRCSLIILLKSFPIVLRRTMGQYNLGESKVALLGLGITTIVEVLKWDGQCSKSIQVLAISMNLQMQSSFLMIDLTWLHVNLSRSRVYKLLHFSIASISSFLENRFHSVVVLSGILFGKWMSTSCAWVELKELWRVFYRSSSLIHGHPSYWIASTTGSLHFLIQFISSHGLHFLFMILSILSSKKVHLDFLTVVLKSFQFSRLHVCRYLFSIWWQSSFHQALECLVMLTVFECLSHMFLILVTKCWTTSSKDSVSWMDVVFKFLITWMRSSMNQFSLLLPLISDCRLVKIFSS